MKKYYLLLALFLLANYSLALDSNSLPGAPTAPAQPLPTEQTGYKTESVSGIELGNLYTVQLAEFDRESDAQHWVRNQTLPTTDIGIAYILDNGTTSYIFATGVHEGLLTASNAADNFCHQNKLQGCWARNLARLETMAAAAKTAAQAATIKTNEDTNTTAKTTSEISP
jgi:hypothetical protein